MFNVTQYLQYKNTLDGKPRVLVEGVDFKVKDTTSLYKNSNDFMYGGVVANLSDCRPLLSVEVDGKVWTELDIVDRGFQLDLLLFFGWAMPRPTFHYSDNDYIDLDVDKPVGSFFDDPVKYSKLLWNCTEEEGWEKVLKLLGVDNSMTK